MNKHIIFYLMLCVLSTFGCRHATLDNKCDGANHSIVPVANQTSGILNQPFSNANLLCGYVIQHTPPDWKWYPGGLISWISSARIVDPECRYIDSIKLNTRKLSTPNTVNCAMLTGSAPTPSQITPSDTSLTWQLFDNTGEYNFNFSPHRPLAALTWSCYSTIDKGEPYRVNLNAQNADSIYISIGPYNFQRGIESNVFELPSSLTQDLECGLCFLHLFTFNRQHTIIQGKSVTVYTGSKYYRQLSVE